MPSIRVVLQFSSENSIEGCWRCRRQCDVMYHADDFISTHYVYSYAVLIKVECSLFIKITPYKM